MSAERRPVVGEVWTRGHGMTATVFAVGATRVGYVNEDGEPLSRLLSLFLDLYTPPVVPIPENVAGELWANVYASGSACGWSSRERAKAASTLNTIGLVRYVLDRETGLVQP